MKKTKHGRKAEKTDNPYKAKSKYIAKIIKKTKWNKHQRIDNLLKLEEYILSGFQIRNFGHGMLIGRLKNDYEKDYNAILKELNPKKYKKDMEEKRKKEEQWEKELEESEREEREAERRAKKAWLKAGGKL